MRDVIVSAIYRKMRRERGKDDILYFAEYYLPHLLENKTPEFHKEILNLLQNCLRVGVGAPRGFAKSTILQIIYGLHCLLYNEGEDILTISQSSSLAEDWVRKLKFEMEGNERIKADFGVLLQWGEKLSKRWTADHLVIQKEGKIFSQIRARGRGCQVRGLRPTKVFCDDLEDEQLVRSEEQRKLLKEWFLGALLNVLKNDQQLVVIGTVLHPLALINDILEKKEQFAGWDTKKYKAITDGKSLWSDRFPIEDLLRRKFEIGTYAFEAEYQNNPIASDTCLWKPDWILRFTKLPEIKHCFAVLDPASTTKDYSDHSGIVVMGVGEDDEIYEIFSIKGKWGLWELIDKVIEVFQRYKPIRFGIEEVAFQNVIRPVLIRKAREMGIRIPVEGISLGKYTGKERNVRQPKDKYTRALSVIHYWEQGIVHLKNQQLIDQVSLFPTGSEDDLVDACVWCVKMIMKYSPIKVMVKQEYKKELTGFEIKDNKIPCLAPLSEMFKPEKDWKLGG